ncbi:MAG: hypothetical protein RL030_1855 [Pseudomonadota bacterium]
MNEAIAQALAAGRTLIVPSRQRAAALSQAWARARSAAGESVWRTPEILTFDAWLAREWQRARSAGRLSGTLQLLNTAQERRLWVQVLGQLEAEGTCGNQLRAHAQALMRSAARSRRSLIDTGRHAVGAEEALLATALREVDRICALNGWWIAGLARAADLNGLSPEAPLFAGIVEPPTLVARIAGLEAGPQRLSLPTPRATPQLHAALDARSEVLAAADWCRRLLRENPARRLLVLNRGAELSIDVVGELLWDRLADGTRAALGEGPDPRLVGIEGGAPLLEQSLFADALAALSLLREPIEFNTVSQLIRSPHLGLLGARTSLQVEKALRDAQRNSYDFAMLCRALLRLEGKVPGAAALARLLGELPAQLDVRVKLGAADWAVRFNVALRTLGFPGNGTVDSRDAQRLARWSELLDEFATLDVLAQPMRYEEALAQLTQLARQGRHEAASLDASITLSGEGGDPLADYDGIWVMGLAESHWPEPPRPDPFVSLAEQRRCAWPESSVSLRAQQARQELAAWQARTPCLVLSYGRYAGDVHQRPSSLLTGLEMLAAPAREASVKPANLVAMTDDCLPELAAPGEAVALPRGVRSVELQHDCPFRAQGELRLGAAPLDIPPGGVGARLRGDLMHAALQELWASVGDSGTLQSLDGAERLRRCTHAWEKAQDTVLAKQLLLPVARALARERLRGIALLADVLDYEALRNAFRVQGREQPREVDLGGPALRLRIDRIDAFVDGTRRVIDYKTGSSTRVRLDVDPPDPVQLAVYASALKADGETPEAVSLLTVSARRLRFSGGGKAGSEAAQGLEEFADWDDRVTRWDAIVRTLAAAHVAGNAQVAPLRKACERCHLQGFCRIGIAVLADEEDDAEGEADASKAGAGDD